MRPNNKLPLRPGVGMMIINAKKDILVGKRIDSKQNAWQMPQGGIDMGETPSKAALREMKEEIGTNNGRIIAESKCWYSYLLPEALVPRLWNGQYSGQRQKWFLIEFLGKDEEINVHTAMPEFSKWCWMPAEELPKKIIQFKSKLYWQVLQEFKPFL